MKRPPKPTKSRSVVFNQLCKLVLVGMVSSLAKESCVDKKSRTFSPRSHVVSPLYCQLTHCIGLNDLCDALRHHSAKLCVQSQAAYLQGEELECLPSKTLFESGKSSNFGCTKSRSRISVPGVQSRCERPSHLKSTLWENPSKFKLPQSSGSAL